jgi:hypothetical protein
VTHSAGRTEANLVALDAADAAIYSRRRPLS